MSGADFDNSEAIANAKEIQLRAAEWIMERREIDNWSAEQQKSLDAWLTESPTHLLAYWRLSAAWEKTHRLAALRHHKPEQTMPNEAAQLVRRIWLRVVSVCVAVGVLGLGGSYFYFYYEPTQTTYATAVGGHKTVTLADGSRVELNTDTILRAFLARSRRTVELEKGEAVFQIHHDANRPFVVLALGHRITDLGTKFLVREDAGQLQVSLMEGRASFESSDPLIQQHSVTMAPGDSVVATAETMSVAKISSKALTRELAWRNQMLIFDEMPLADAVTEFNRYNREKLDVTDPQIANLKIDGTFRTDNVRGFLDMTRHVLGLQITQRGEKILISR